MKYAVHYDISSDGVTVSFPDIPEALTCGDDLDDAKAMAQDALLTAFEFYFEDNRAVPAPLAEAEHYIDVPLSLEAKIYLLNSMLEARISNAELARRIHVKPQEITRLVNLKHNTKIDTLARALQALGKQLRLEVA
ncbi:type II toxin-antitoxin system HicB family antitoxin [Reinekea thalattae]|uniref:Type II toxin-antitoxin system HicB family antitoxin n=1 Tax=Reinekea thalattae TaxID=2593301 RepID=A0A5C8Z9M4_9GAMM|nr:type II toxin-antitoxin system HicB family antitoxin [Reinekea thalattae]TXR53566.1 type II toxin-antitoxin system HicB family antitoxin [Reinekea thalattae]